jgi:hypothetical protein
MNRIAAAKPAEHGRSLPALGASIGVGQPYIKQTLLDDPPLAADDYTFITQAVVQIGKATDKQWAEPERTTLYYPEPVPVAVDRSPQLLALDVDTPHPSGVMRVITESMRAEAQVKRARLLDLIEEEQAYYQVWCAGVEANRGGIEALNSAYRHLAKAVLNGAFTLHLQPVGGGKMASAEASLFSNMANRLNAIRFGTVPVDGELHYLFFEAKQLERAFPLTSALTPVRGIDSTALSKYLQLALHVHEQGFGPTFGGEKKYVQRALVEAAGMFGLTLSGEQEKYLATFLRNPDVQAGRNRRA